MLRSRALVVGAGCVTVALLGLSDYLSGPELSFLIFYLVPVLLVSWYAGAAPGFALSLLSTLVWLLANDGERLSFTNPVVPYWNTATRLALFILLSYVIARLRERYEREKDLSRTDYLTGAANRRFLIEQLEAELARMERYGRLVTLVYLDIDRFKRVNDELGHAEGDRVLKAVARALRGSLRRTDVVARIGGDEFALLLPETGAVAARSLLPRVLDELFAAVETGGWAVSFSLGVVSAGPPAPTLDALMGAADRLMYAAKRNPANPISYEVLSGSPAGETLERKAG